MLNCYTPTQANKIIIDETIEEECSQVMKSNGRSIMGSPIVVHCSLRLFCIVANMM